MNLQSENVPHFLCLLIAETISNFLKIQNWPNSFFQKSRSEKIRFFENFPSKIIVNKLWTAVKNPQVLQHQLCLLSEKNKFQRGLGISQSAEQKQSKKVAISGNFRSGRLPNIVLSSVSVTKQVLGNTTRYVYSGENLMCFFYSKHSFCVRTSKKFSRWEFWIFWKKKKPKRRISPWLFLENIVEWKWALHLLSDFWFADLSPTLKQSYATNLNQL